MSIVLLSRPQKLARKRSAATGIAPAVTVLTVALSTVRAAPPKPPVQRSLAAFGMLAVVIVQIQPILIAALMPLRQLVRVLPAVAGIAVVPSV